METVQVALSFFNLIMINQNKSQAKEEYKKKRVTFLVCTDKRDSKEPTQLTNELAGRLSKCVDRNWELSNKFSNSAVVYHKDTVMSEAVKGCDVKKTLVRNADQALPPLCALVRGRPYHSIPVDIIHSKQGANISSNYKSKYAAPELYTTLCIAKEIQDIAKTNAKRPSGLDITPAAKQMLDVKVLKKLNFPLEEKLYKDLVSLTVSNEELFGSNGRSRSQREVEFRQSKDQEPQLTDFYAPAKAKEYNVVEQPVHCGTQRIRRYNGFT